MRRLRGSLLNLLQGLWFVPGLGVLVYAALAVVLVETDKRAAVAGGPLFEGDVSAARSVLSVIAGSLITVAGLTFSITIVVLQLTSSQFSPRILRTFFGDRLTQVTVGSFVGIFVYSLVVLRSVGAGRMFVPRLSITIASVLAIVAVVLLIVFIHHVSQLIQVSYVTGDIAAKTLARLEALYPEAYVEDAAATASGVSLDAEAGGPGSIRPKGPGYVRRIELERLVAGLPNGIERLEVIVRPGDFVSGEEPLGAVWPAERATDCAELVRKCCRIERERDLDQDLDFGLRQLVDTAVKATSPGINDPTTACTCVGYIRSIVVSLAARSFPEVSFRSDERALTVVARRREFAEYLESLFEVGRHAATDVRVTVAVVDALHSVADSAAGCAAADRASAAARLAQALGLAAGENLATPHERERLERRLAWTERFTPARSA